MIKQNPWRADIEGDGAGNARDAVRREVGSPAFLAFAAGRGRAGEERTVAIASADRLRQVGFGKGDRDRAVHLSAQTVETHPRFAAFEADDWRRVQHIVDQGEWAARGATHRLLWLEDAGKPWLTVLKRTASGEVYLQSYRRARPQEVERIRSGGLEPGGPQPPPPNMRRAG